MLNPILGRNLGRWAHVYFTSPPEKREQAILELLRELQAESGNVPKAQATVSIYEVPKRPVAQEPGTGAECGHPNSPGQRFCGLCGSALLSQPATQGSANRPAKPAGDAEVHPEETRREQVFPTLSLFAEVLDERPPEPSNGHRASEVDWLRDKNLQMERASELAGSWSKYGFVLLAVMLLGFLYYANLHRSRSPARTSRSVPAAAAATEGLVRAQARQPAPTQAPAAKPPAPSTVLAAKNPGSAPVTQQPARAVPAPTRPAATLAPSPKPAPAIEPAIPSASRGTVELTTAQSYLEGKNRPRDSAVAANFLWLAVRKENGTALLLLADLYLAGDGVQKSCDQARILLMAGVRKQVPEAITKLRQLETAGCP